MSLQNGSTALKIQIQWYVFNYQCEVGNLVVGLFLLHLASNSLGFT